ncbi:unnamed protein product [marine sediment metagenome]|uniref:Uncharacterized protein n=1 Tax=marine sediment metagenome TaxID=412755 RepID=X0TA05_9ZZZZ
MLRVFNVNAESAVKAEKYLFISGFEFEKKERREKWSNDLLEVEFRLDVSKEEKFKIDRIGDFVSFKGMSQIEKFVDDFFPEGHTIYQTESGWRGGKYAFVFYKDKLHKIHLGKFIKYITKDCIYENFLKKGISLKEIKLKLLKEKLKKDKDEKSI